MTDRTLREKIEALYDFKTGPHCGGYISKRAVLAIIDAHTAQPAPDAVAEADETRLFVPRGTGCASDQCNRPASVHFIRGGVGSYYCAACYITIQSQGKRP